MDLRDWVWKSACPLSLSQAAVWAALAALRRRDQPEQLVYPSLEEIAAAAKVSKRTVIRALKDLEQLEVITIYRKTKKGSARDEVNRYRVKVYPEQPADLAEKVAKLKKKGDQVSMSTAVESHQVVVFPPDQVSQRPRLGVTDPPDQVSMSTSKPCHEALPIETITSNALRASNTTADPFGISTGSDLDAGMRPSADDAAAPRADDGDQGGSVCEVGVRSAVLTMRDVGDPTEQQVSMLADLYRLAYDAEADWKFYDRARHLDQDGVTRYKQQLYREIQGRGNAYAGPAEGDAVYDSLSPIGKAWASVGLDPSMAVDGTSAPAQTEEEPW